MVKYELKEFGECEWDEKEDSSIEDLCYGFNLKSLSHENKKIEKHIGRRFTDDEKEQARRATVTDICDSDMRAIYVGDDIAGCLTTKIAEHMTLERGYYEEGIFIQCIYLKKKYRNLGIGSDIVSNLLRKDDIYLNVCKYRPKAIRFYERLGFEVKQKSTHYINMKHERINN